MTDRKKSITFWAETPEDIKELHMARAFNTNFFHYLIETMTGYQVKKVEYISDYEAYYVTYPQEKKGDMVSVKYDSQASILKDMLRYCERRNEGYYG